MESQILKLLPTFKAYSRSFKWCLNGVRAILLLILSSWISEILFLFFITCSYVWEPVYLDIRLLLHTCLIKYLKNLFGQTLSLTTLNAYEGFYSIILEMKKKNYASHLSYLPLCACPHLGALEKIILKDLGQFL